MAGHCRMEIWLRAIGSEELPVLPNVQRTFDIGHLVERAMFDGFAGALVGNEPDIPPWWPQIEEVVDYEKGTSIVPAYWDLVPGSRQKEVELDGFVGHIDALVSNGKGPIGLLDCKTAPSLTWDRNLKGDLLANPFSREYVLQLHWYRAALGVPAVDWMALLYVNKENSKVMMRVVDYDPDLEAEAKERLSWAKSGAEPTPDWVWDKAKPIPLRCGYCSFKDSCAEMRGVELDLRPEKGTPKWFVK